MGQPIVAVLFDFDHTLGVDNQLEERVLRDLAKRFCGITPPDSDIVSALGRFRAGSVGLAAMLGDAFSKWGYRGDVLADYRAEALRLLPSSLAPEPGAAETLKALQSAKLTIAILSNGWTELQRAKATLIGFHGPVIVSEAIGAWKPDRRAFEIAARQLQIDVAEAMYVGDSPAADVAGSKNAGMTAVWADLEGQTYPDGVARPDYTITRLDQLMGIVGSR